MKNVIFTIVFFILAIISIVAPAAAQADSGERSSSPKITSRPRAAYTDEARANNVSGIVSVKVTFLADGKIGEVVDVEENAEDLRKYGLVKQTILAAGKIKFEPATKDDRPVTVIKIMKYAFTIY